MISFSIKVMLLEDLGCNSAMMFLDQDGDLYNLGSADGVSFLSTNPDIVLKFRTHFCMFCVCGLCVSVCECCVCLCVSVCVCV